jgi:hypothetical protein
VAVADWGADAPSTGTRPTIVGRLGDAKDRGTNQLVAQPAESAASQQDLPVNRSSSHRGYRRQLCRLPLWIVWRSLFGTIVNS